MPFRHLLTISSPNFNIVITHDYLYFVIQQSPLAVHILVQRHSHRFRYADQYNTLWHVSSAGPQLWQMDPLSFYTTPLTLIKQVLNIEKNKKAEKLVVKINGGKKKIIKKVGKKIMVKKSGIKNQKTLICFRGDLRLKQGGVKKCRKISLWV